MNTLRHLMLATLIACGVGVGFGVLAPEGESAQPVSPTVAANEEMVIFSPVPGLFTASMPPVQVGDMVEPSTVLGSVDRMEVTAGIRGKLAEAMVQDGAMVDAGQPMFRIKAMRMPE